MNKLVFKKTENKWKTIDRVKLNIFTNYSTIMKLAQSTNIVYHNLSKSTSNYFQRSCNCDRGRLRSITTEIVQKYNNFRDSAAISSQRHIIISIIVLR